MRPHPLRNPKAQLLTVAALFVVGLMAALMGPVAAGGAALALLAAVTIPHAARRWREVREGTRASFMRDNRAQLDLGISGMLALVGTILGAIVVVLVLANLLPEFIPAIGDINNELADTQNQSFNDTTSDNLRPVFTIVIGISALVGIVGLVLAAISFRRG